eukprot:1170827-Prorocentrum_minimum.AAC.1
MSRRQPTRQDTSPSPNGSESGGEEEVDLRQLVEQLQRRLNETEVELHLLKNQDKVTTRRKRVSLAP